MNILDMDIFALDLFDTHVWKDDSVLAWWTASS